MDLERTARPNPFLVDRCPTTPGRRRLLTATQQHVGDGIKHHSSEGSSGLARDIAQQINRDC